MKRRIVLAAVLGVVLGVAVGYSPSVQPTAAPRTLLMQQVSQPNVASPLSQAAPNSLPLLLIALIAGLVIAGPVFIVAKHKAR
jgi:ABC-type dipeptide/oligopeptide/nickel transport system permease component